MMKRFYTMLHFNNQAEIFLEIKIGGGGGGGRQIGTS